MHIPEHRPIVGTEMEHSPLLIPSDADYKPHYLGDHDARFIIAEVDPALGLDRGEGYANNGSRIYQDMSKVEYATPECRSYRDAVHATYAGEAIVLDALRNFVGNNETYKNFNLLGRVIDNHCMTWGYHENYLVGSASIPAYLKYNIEEIDELDYSIVPGTKVPGEISTDWPLCRAMLAHLATRTVLTGAGIMRPREGGYAVLPGQKVLGLYEEVGYGTTSEYKTLFNLRNSSYADDSYWSRMHVTSGDYNTSPWAQWMSLGTTAITAYLAQVSPDSTNRLRMKKGAALEAARNIGINPDHVFLLASGKSVRAIDVQEMECESAEIFDRNHPELLTAEDKLILDHWRRAIDTYRQDRTLLRGDVGWIQKIRVLESFVAKYPNISYDSLVEVEQSIDNLNNGVAKKTRAYTKMPGYSEVEIARLKHEPVQDTRAKIRCEILRAVQLENAGDIYVGWDFVKRCRYNDTGNSTPELWLLDPYQTELNSDNLETLSQIFNAAQAS